MVKVTFVQPDGSEETIDAAPGQSMMEAAQASGIRGIVADCGGNCSCGTCRVFVAPEWRARTGTASELELDMLEMHEERQDGERLCCQITLADDLTGVRVAVPKSQF
ncbi:2Fe-2S ferredoxin [Novosphingobium chloroacetimidivorans]|uniref:2Fe-2S ferredoxin n=1 Tax=Novosphingobium chloroacetimidivorans TaxID=1428314 RepID=A0A7W7K9T5_9SPHN|nr:2Fe-2S iron-sulfur cluster-binding protein [Novosphingobium chloroacetimidivorans]MBB4858882.1 2Fe-2S ferredoxin [Novosphingobium chloroacetimidivorans]